MNTCYKLTNILTLASMTLLAFASCKQEVKSDKAFAAPTKATPAKSLPQADNTGIAIAQAAESIIDKNVDYDPAYFQIPYPNGDVPADKGVCTDVVIRALRKLNIDLQKTVHEDMAANFGKYPKIWGMKGPDKNIDHRRVPNLMVYFARKGYSIPVTKNPKDYLPGDIVTWTLDKGMTHIGIVSLQASPDGERYQIVHNIGAGQVLEDCLFRFFITGHYRIDKL